MSMEGQQSNDMPSILDMDLLEHEGEEDDLVETFDSDKVSHDCSNPSKQTSKAWAHFRKGKKEKQGTQVFCKYCDAMYIYTVVNGTSTMLKHLKRCSKSPQNVDKRQKLFAARRTQLTMGNTTNIGDASGNVLSTWKFDQERCRKMLVRMIIMDEQPFSLVERVGFRDFISELQPPFNHISRFTVSRDCMKLYLGQKISLKTYFHKLKSRVTLTTDTWISSQNLSYLCLTAHFIDDDWKLNKRIINFVVVTSHKGKDIGRMVEKCIYEWGIERKMSTITVDNASSNDVAIGFLKEKLSKDKLLILDGGYLHMRCTAHIINLIVREGLKEVRESISRIRGAITYVKGSPKRAETFKTCIERARITYKGSVCLDVPTRWNSTYLMLDVALKLRKAFERMEEDYPCYVTELEKEHPKNDDWENTKALSIFLKKFYDGTKEMFGTLYITSNDYFVGIAFLYRSLRQAETALIPRVKEMATKMKEKFDKYYGSFEKVNMMVLIAVILDPRKKMHYVRRSYRLIYDDSAKVDDSCDNVRIALERLFRCYEKSYLSSCNKYLGAQHLTPTASSSTSSKDPHCPDEDSQKKLGFDDWDEELEFECPDEEDRILSKPNESELDKYLKAEHEESCNLNLLMWWSAVGQKFNVLSLMARDILAISVTIVVSESTFSTSSRVLDNFRSSLTHRVAETLICTQDWLRVVNKPINVEECIVNAEKFECDMDDAHLELIGKSSTS